MPSDKSLYRKIQLVLDVAQSVKASSLTDLCTEIQYRKMPTFETLQYNEKRDEFCRQQSGNVIRRVVTFCHRMSLIETDGALTKLGRQAVRKSYYDKVVAEQARLLLQEGGIDLDSLNAVISDKLRASPPVLPTAGELWAAMKAEISKAEFSRMLTLLAHAGAAKSAQCKVYLSFARH